MLALGTWWWLAALLAAGLSFALSLVLLRPIRERAAIALYESQQRRAQRVNPDDVVEDAEVERLESKPENP